MDELLLFACSIALDTFWQKNYRTQTCFHLGHLFTDIGDFRTHWGQYPLD